MDIYIAQDPNCISPRKVRRDILGGSERYLLKLGEFMRDELGHDVSGHDGSPADPGKVYDVCIHSNVVRKELGIKAEKTVLWAGSWHASGYEDADLTICVSDYFKNRMGWQEAKVIPPFYTEDVESARIARICKALSYCDTFSIGCNSNPNRYKEHVPEILEYLSSNGLNVSWSATGGNALYFSDCSNENFDFDHLLMDREKLLFHLMSCHVWAYPNFTDDSETFGVAPLEAMVIGLPVYLPEREPFISIRAFEGATFCKSPRDMGEKILVQLSNFVATRFCYPIVGYPYIKEYTRERLVKKFTEELEDLF